MARMPFATATFLVLLSAGALPAQVQVRPGGVVKMSVEGARECVLGGDSWEPASDTCWFPIDLLQPAGPLDLLVRAASGDRRAVVEVSEYPYDLQVLEIEDDSRVHLSPENEERAARERERVVPLFSLKGPRQFGLPLHPPLDDLPSGGRFGSRRIINGEPRSPHTGSDFAANTGTPVYSVANGRVALAEEHFFAGNSVFVDHGGGLLSMYFHLSRIDVRPGQEVRRGERLGAVGATGRATGPHLHFGLRWYGARVDPELLIGSVSQVPEVASR